MLTEGGGGVHDQAYVSIVDLRITFTEAFLMLIFMSKRVCLEIIYAIRPESLRFLGKSVCYEVIVVKIEIFAADTLILTDFW